MHLCRKTMQWCNSHDHKEIEIRTMNFRHSIELNDFVTFLNKIKTVLYNNTFDYQIYLPNKNYYFLGRSVFHAVLENILRVH